jgi:hypothetical protein
MYRSLGFSEVIDHVCPDGTLYTRARPVRTLFKGPPQPRGESATSIDESGSGSDASDPEVVVDGASVPC